MDAISTSDILTTIVGGILITTVANLLKPYTTKYNPQLIVFTIGMTLGLLYTVFVTFVPVEYRTAIVNFVFNSLSSAVLIYEFIWKNIKDKLGIEKIEDTKKDTK